MKQTERELKIISAKCGSRTYFYIIISTANGFRYITGALHTLKEAQRKLEGLKKNGR